MWERLSDRTGANLRRCPLHSPGVPKYARVKLFLPFLPFAAVLAACALEVTAHSLRQRFATFPASARWVGPTVLMAAPVLVTKYYRLPVLWQLEVEGVPLLTIYRLQPRSALAAP